MTSSVFFKFKSQKEPTRVEFDGTGISVFELKREVIIKSGLGDGTDFDLAIYAEDGAEEYDDDMAVIPRATTVIARRLPAAKSGAGRAARYISGKMPGGSKNSQRKEQAAKSAVSASLSNAISQMHNALTEEDRMVAMFQAQSEQLSANQGEISQHNFRQSFQPKKVVHAPDHDPPNGYVCYRCGEKGHWIQKCPTNDNAEFDNRPRLKRTTGIPRSFLKTVDKSVALAQPNGDDDLKRPTGIMMNADGQFVIAEPDKASWEIFQAKTKSSAAANAVSADDKEIQERGLDCSLDKKMFIDPMKTPCCQKTYCNDCITNSLIESDLVCPACQQEGVLIDDLQPDDEMAERIKQYLKEKESRNTKSPAASSPPIQSPPQGPETKIVAIATATEATAVPAPASAAQDSAKSPCEHTSKLASDGTDEMSLIQGKKRSAEDVLDDAKIPKAPKAMQNQNAQASMAGMAGTTGRANMAGIAGMAGMAGPMNVMPMMSGMVSMPMANVIPYAGGMNMNMNMNMMGSFPVGMNMPMMNSPQMGMTGNPMMSMMTPMLGMGAFHPMPGGFPVVGQNPMMGGGGGFDDMGAGGGARRTGGGGGERMGMMNSTGGHGFGIVRGDLADGPKMPYQQQQQQQHLRPQPNGTNISYVNLTPTVDDDAYFRKPVNPHRHQNRQRRVRPSDYREL